MIFLIIQVLLLPVRLIQFLYYQLFGFFKKGEYLYIEVPHKFSSVRKTTLMRLITSDEDPPSLVDFLNDLKLISENRFIKKVFFMIDRIDFGLAELKNITDGIEKIRKSGKKTAGFCETGDLKSIYLLSSMEERYTSESGEFQSILPSAESFFFGKLAKKAGIGVESFASGKYKSFAETFSRDSFSKEAKANLSDLIKSVRSQLVRQIEN
ncbi:MAG: S49 family peptidase, partial [Leptospira sp.]|nr:S49 family peptidase [Leptospira sp.]